MCFNQKYSAVFAIMGIISLLVVKKKSSLLHIPIIFYTIMEILQTIQYSYVNNCDSTNRLLTEISYLLIIVQPIMWNLIFLYRSSPLTNYNKGILYCAIVLCAIWILAHVMRRFKNYSNNYKSKDNDHNPEITAGNNTCTYKKDNEHLYWNYELFSNPGMDANWFMYLMLWFIPGLLIPGEKLTIFAIMAGFFGSLLYVKSNNHTKHITPSLWCLTSGPTLALNVLYSFLS